MRGFTLIEVVLALVIFEFGMLALAATIAVSARDLGDANLRAKAHAVAAARVARLRAPRCPPAASGILWLTGGLVEHWSVSVDGELRRVADSVSIARAGGRAGQVVVQAWTRCD